MKPGKKIGFIFQDPQTSLNPIFKILPLTPPSKFTMSPTRTDLSKIIENSNKLKKEYESKGYSFKSQTDTEVITIILTDFLKTDNLIDCIHKTLEKLEGSFALGVIFKDFNNLVVGARRGSPLAVGYGHDENFIGSDSYALKSMTNKISYLDDGGNLSFRKSFHGPCKILFLC